MKIYALRLLALICSSLAITAYAAKIIIDPPPDVPGNFSTQELTGLISARNGLLVQLRQTQEIIDGQARDCHDVEQGSPKVDDCMARAGEVKKAVKNYRAELERFKASFAENLATQQSKSGKQGYEDRDALENARIIAAINAYAKRFTPPWSEKKLASLEYNLNHLFGLNTKGLGRDGWREIYLRGADSEIAKFMDQYGDGQGLAGAGAGRQTTHEDCAVFAIANATDTPYSIVAGRATAFIADGGWHTPNESKNPTQVIEGKGLNGGEVVLLAESFGQAHTVEHKDIARTLQAGERVLIGIVAEGGARHEVVIDKAVVKEGKQWYEIADSNQGPTRKLYVNEDEMQRIEAETGVAVKAAPHATPALLR